MENKAEFISAIIKIISHFERIGNQRWFGGLGDAIRALLGYPPQNQPSDTIKANFINFYYKRRLREIKKIIDENHELFEENIGDEKINLFIKNIEDKLNSKTPDLFEYYDNEDEAIKQFINFLNIHFGEDIKRYRDTIKKQTKKKSQLIRKAAKNNPDQGKFDF